MGFSRLHAAHVQGGAARTPCLSSGGGTPSAPMSVPRLRPATAPGSALRATQLRAAAVKQASAETFIMLEMAACTALRAACMLGARPSIVLG